MRQQHLSPERRTRKFRYAFEVIIDQVRINVKFPCRISVSWNYGDGEVRTGTSRALTGGIAKFDEKLAFPVILSLDQNSQKYLQLRSTVEISIITDNGTSLAGFVNLDLGNFVNRKDRKQQFQIQRCPDRSACIRMRISHNLMSQKPKNRVKLGRQSDDSEFEENRSVTPRSEYVPKTEYAPAKRVVRVEQPSVSTVSKNKELIEKELMILKGRVNEFENKFKNQRSQKEKISELLKTKQEAMFSVKTEIKKKQIETEDLSRSLEEQRSQYARLKAIEENLRRDSEKTVKSLESNQRSLLDKIIKLETELSASERKNEKTSLENERIKKQKENLFALHKEKMDEGQKDRDSLAETIRTMKRDRQELVKQFRMEKETLDKTVRELTKNIKDATEELETARTKAQTTDRKLAKFEETRIEQTQKFNMRINQLDKIRQTLALQAESLKSTLNKKQVALIQATKSHQQRFTEQKSTTSTLKTQLSQLQFQRATLQKDLTVFKQSSRANQQQSKRLDKQNTALKSQISSLSDQLQAKTLQIRTLTTKQKDLQEELVKQRAQLQEVHEQAVNQLNNRLKQAKRAEDGRNANNLKIIARKDKEIEEAVAREDKLLLVIEGFKDQAKKTEQANKEKLEAARKVESGLKLQLQQSSKRLEKLNQQSTSKCQTLLRQLSTLEQSLADSKDLLARSTQRQSKLRQELQSLTQQMLSFEQTKQLVTQYQDRLKQYDKRVDELSEELQAKDLRIAGLSKQISELKERLAESQADKNKREAFIREKDKQIATLTKQFAQENQEKKRELGKREAEVKAVQEEMREAIRKERARFQELSSENDRLNNDLTVAVSNCQQLTKAAQRLQQQLRNFRQNQRSLLQQKQELLRSRQQSEHCRRQLQQLHSSTQQTLLSRQRQLRTTKQQLTDLQQSHSDQLKSSSRNNLLVEQLIDIAGKLSAVVSMGSSGVFRELSQSGVVAMRTSSVVNTDYDRLLELRKMIVVAEGRWRKEIEIFTEREAARAKEKERDNADLEKIGNQLQKLRAQATRYKKENEELLYSNDFMKIENQQLLYKIDGLESELGGMRAANLALQARSKELGSEAERGEQESKQLQARYEALIQETRTSLTEKTQKIKKQLTATIRKLQVKIEELEQRKFQLELQSQKAGQLARRQQEHKKVLARVYQLQRQNQQLGQASTQKTQKAQRQLQKALWQKKSVQDSLATATTKLQRTTTQFQQQVQRSSTRCKQLTQQLRQRQQQLSKSQQTSQRLQFQLSTLKANSQQQRDKWSSADNKWKAETAKLKADVQQLRKVCEEQREQLMTMETLRLARNALEEELAARDKAYTLLQDREERQAEELFRLTQRLEEQKWEIQQSLDAKQAEIIAMQEQLYAMNSKENVRILKDNETYDRIRQLEGDKKSLIRELADLKTRIREAQSASPVSQVDQPRRNAVDREIATFREDAETLSIKVKNAEGF